MDYKIDDIVKNDLCIGCGICTSESKNSVMIKNEFGFLVPRLDNSFNENAIKVCPFNPNPDYEVQDEDKLATLFLNDAPKFDKNIGKFHRTYAGYSKQFRSSSSSGGIATYIFKSLLQKNIVNHLFIVKEINGKYAYQWFNDVEDIIQISKTRYIPVTLAELFKEIDSKEGKVAVSGVACFLKAIRLKQHYSPIYKEKIPFLVGIICGGVKSEFFTDYLAQKSGIKGSYSNQNYRIKNPDSIALDYSFGAFDSENNLHKIDMKSVGDMWGSGLFKANPCDFCDDVTTELADISLGDAWIKPYSQDGRGTNVIVTRSQLADFLIKEGRKLEDLVIEDLDLHTFKSSQAGGFRHRQNAEKFRLKLLKGKGSILPFKRKRMLTSIPIEYKYVQRKRRKIRAKSLIVWKQNPDCNTFDDKINPLQTNLRKINKFYRLVQKLKHTLNINDI